MSDKYVDLLAKGRAAAEKRIRDWNAARTKSGTDISEVEGYLRGSGVVGDGLKMENHGRAITISSKSPTKRHLLIRAEHGQLLLLKVENSNAEEKSVASCTVEHDETSKEEFFVAVGEHTKYLEEGDEWL